MKKIGRIFFIVFCLCFIAGGTKNLVPRAYAASAMKASEACVEFIKQVEGFSAKPYYDYGQHTVGYGTKCPTEKYLEYFNVGIPKQEAEELLRKTISGIEADIQEKLIDKYQHTFTQNQFDALVSFTFNLGSGWMTYDSILRNAILKNAGEPELVHAFSLYSTAGGKYLSSLIIRRLCEANIYINGVYNKRLSDAYGYVLYEPNGGGLTYRAQGFLCGTNTKPAADAVRNGDVFLGWYTDLTGGTKVEELDSSLTGKTLFARWQSAEDSEAHDSPSVIVRVTGDVVNIRNGPGTNYGIAAQVRMDDVLVVSHVSHLSSMRWGKVQEGWICLDYTNYDDVVSGNNTMDEDSNDPPSDAVTVPDNSQNTNNAPDNTDKPAGSQKTVFGIVRVNDLLRIRSGPGTDHTTVGYLVNGRNVEILEQKTVGSMVWGRITPGWISMDYIRIVGSDMDSTVEPDTEENQKSEPEQDHESSDAQKNDTAGSANQAESTVIKGKIKADALRIRSAPGAENRILGFYYQNDMVVIVEKILVDSVYWGKTDKGWIHMDYVMTDSSNEESAGSHKGKVMTVIADCLRVRKETATSSRIAELLYYGDTVTVFETITVDEVTWGRVANGWVCMDYVK